MKVCFDTSVVIDILGKTEFHAECCEAYQLALLRDFDPLLSVSSTTDIVYVLQSRKLVAKQSVHETTGRVFGMFDLVDNIAADAFAAHNSGMTDYEDALIAHSAERAGASILVTRDKKSFTNSPIAAMSPAKFIETFSPRTETGEITLPD